MRSRHRIGSMVIVLFAVWFARGFNSLANAASIPEDQAGFTDYIARALAKAMPDANVSVAAPMFLVINSPTGGNHQGNVQTPYSQCQAIPDRCDAIVTTWVAQMSAQFSRPTASLDRGSLRIVLRPAAYVDQLRRSQNQEPVAAPFISGLWMICAADRPTAIEFPPAKQFAELGLSPTDAISLCKQNTVAALTPMASVAKPAPAGSIEYITDGPYSSSRILMPGLWKPLADQGGGQLIAAVPGSDVVLYTQASDPASIAALRTLARDVMTKVTRTISPAVFRWTPTGFQEIEP